MGRKWVALALLALALIVLPTGTPEDLVTTVVLIDLLGWSGYMWLAIATLVAVVLLLPDKYFKRVFRRE